MLDPWILLKLNPEDSIEAKISYCIDFFESSHPLLEHIAVIDFVTCQTKESTGFKQTWEHYCFSCGKNLYFTVRSIASLAL
jgi:hypothetical protein